MEAEQNSGGAAPVLRVAGVTAGYGEQPVLREVSLDVQLGEWVALLGPNGSGKSTLLYCVGGMLRPTSGAIEVCGTSLARNARVAKSALGFACAPERLPGLLTGRQCLEVYAAAKGVRRVDSGLLDLMVKVGLEAHLDEYVDTYSVGTRQKLAVALALIGAPKLIVLDEAFNGLDPMSGREVRRYLRGLVAARCASVLLATHAVDVVERHADRAALLLDGRMAWVWNAAELSVLRSSAEGLEDAIAAASEAPLRSLR